MCVYIRIVWHFILYIIYTIRTHEICIYWCVTNQCITLFYILILSKEDLPGGKPNRNAKDM